MYDTMTVRLTAAALAPLRLGPSSIHSSRRLSPLPAWSQKTRSLSQSFLRKVAEGEERWKARKKAIETGDQQHIWDILVERGFIKDVVGEPNRIKSVILSKRIGAYVGVDPSGPSLHIGHMVPIMALFWLWFHGHPAMLLIGGATARIGGDPTGRLKSRELISNADISKNIIKIHYQMTRLWHNVQQLQRRFGYEDDWAAKKHLFNNNMWHQGLKLYDFMKRIARHTRVGPMLSRDTAKRKMTEGDGLSVGELLYPLIQGWDFWHMYDKLSIQMQIGGQDQFGNILAGCEALKIIRDSEEAPELRRSAGWRDEPIGFTVPLLTDSSGAKLGKTEGNAVWLDEFKTSAFDLYGHFVRQSDDEVERLLKLLTFLPMSKIKSVMEEHELDKSKRVAQHTLAFEFLSLIYGSQKALEESQQHKFRFGGETPTVVKEPDASYTNMNANTAPRSDMELPRSVLDLSPARLLYASGIVPSISEGHRLVKASGAYIAGQSGQMRGLTPGNMSWTPMSLWFPGETNKFLLDNRMLILRRGKHNVRIIELVEDKVWQDSKRTYPGQPFTGKMRTMKKQIMDESMQRGLKLSTKDVNKLLKEKIRGQQMSINPNIKLPIGSELREKNEQIRMLSEEVANEEWIEGLDDEGFGLVAAEDEKMGKWEIPNEHDVIKDTRKKWEKPVRGPRVEDAETKGSAFSSPFSSTFSEGTESSWKRSSRNSRFKDAETEDDDSSSEWKKNAVNRARSGNSWDKSIRKSRFEDSQREDDDFSRQWRDKVVVDGAGGNRRSFDTPFRKSRAGYAKEDPDEADTHHKADSPLKADPLTLENEEGFKKSRWDDFGKIPDATNEPIFPPKRRSGNPWEKRGSKKW